MSNEKKAASKETHTTCVNPCKVCNSKGYLENKEVCPSCGGTGCKDRKSCTPSGGLDCEI